MSALFRGIQQTINYAKFRPSYPVALFEYVRQQLRCAPGLVVDVGCGTGQATLELSKLFHRVIGMDPSTEQISQISVESIPRNTTFQVCNGTEGLRALDDNSVACITAAQAAHWFDLPEFYTEVQRVLKNGGVVAFWTYGLIKFESEQLEQVVNRGFYEDSLRPYWDERVSFVEAKYETLPKLDAPGYRIERLADKFDIDIACTPAELIGFLRSWSGYNTYCNEHEITQGSEGDPILPIESVIKENNINSIRGKWQVTLLMTFKD